MAPLVFGEEAEYAPVGGNPYGRIKLEQSYRCDTCGFLRYESELTELNGKMVCSDCNDKPSFDDLKQGV